MSKTNSYKSVLQKAYNELRSIFDGSQTKEYEYDDCIFYLKMGSEGEIIKYYYTKGYKNFDSIELCCDEILNLEQEYKRDKIFSILIDNTNEERKDIIWFHEEYFKTEEQMKEKILEIMKSKNKINFLLVYYCNKLQFSAFFDENNKLEMITTIQSIKPSSIFSNLDKENYNFNSFIYQNEFLLPEKIKFLGLIGESKK